MFELILPPPFITHTLHGSGFESAFTTSGHRSMLAETNWSWYVMMINGVQSVKPSDMILRCSCDFFFLIYHKVLEKLFDRFRPLLYLKYYNTLILWGPGSLNRDEGVYLNLPPNLPDRKHKKKPKFISGLYLWVWNSCMYLFDICFRKEQTDSHDHLINVMGRGHWVLPEEGKIACHCLFEANPFPRSILLQLDTLEEWAAGSIMMPHHTRRLMQAVCSQGSKVVQTSKETKESSCKAPSHTSIAVVFF